MKRLAVLGVAAVATLGLAACTSVTDGTPNSLGQQAPSSAPAPGFPSSGSVPTSPGTQPTAPSTSGSSTGSADLRSQLLTVDDLPGGWTVDTSSNDGGDDTAVPSCLQNLPGSGSGGGSDDEADFVRGQGVPILQESLDDLGDESTAHSAFTLFSQALDGCTDLSFDSGGVQFTGSIKRIQFPQAKDESAVWQMALSAQGITLGIDLMVVRDGSEIMTLLYGDLNLPVDAEFSQLVSAAVGKLP